MNRYLRALSIVAFSVFTGCASGTAIDNPWAKVLAPSSGVAHSIGKPGAGCLMGAQPLELDGPGYQVMRVSRHRYYGHPELVQFLRDLGAADQAHLLKPLLIGDLGMPRGGPMPTGHASHQIGVDADIWFMLAPKANLTLDEREKLEAPTMLSADRQGLNHKRWGNAQKWILQQAVADARVDRVFVNPVIKRELCIKEPGAAWLHKVRPWWGHDDHWHVRLKCSAQDPACVATETIPPGSGCDSTLDWWFSDEAKQKGIENNAKSGPRVLPKLPDECAAVLGASNSTDASGLKQP